MFQRFHKKLQDREEGFTLIELLVVILIIAILAAIAIPVFLKQREKGWVAQAESALKNSTTAAESYLVGPGDGNYVGLSEATLNTEGFKKAADVTAVVVNTDAAGTKYCVQVSHANLSGQTFGISSNATTPNPGTCAGGDFTATP